MKSVEKAGMMESLEAEGFQIDLDKLSESFTSKDSEEDFWY